MKIIIRNKTPIIVSRGICYVFNIIFGVPIGAVAVFPFVIVRDNEILENKDYINHESIHIRQYIETLVFGLLIIGAFQYLYALLVLRKSRLQAYYYMSHEQEAHQNDRNHDYLKTRKWFSYYRYLNPKNRKSMDLINGKRIIYYK